nr:ABC transporter ATP-binding protein [Acuticoccus kandeliae]
MASSSDIPTPRAAPVTAPAETHGVPIVFDGLTKRYREVAAVDDFNLSVDAGEFLTILGPSGSGKTTLLMLVAGFTAPDSGRLLVAGKDVAPLPPHRRDIGVVFQSYALFPHLTVAENIAFPLAARGVARTEIGARVEAALAQVRLTGFGARRISELSGGQQQRVAFARAIVFRPAALLMDEPLSALDRALRLEMQAELRELQRAVGHTTIYVTHDQEEALNLSDRIAVMNRGRLQQVGTPADVYARPANPFVARFFGEANLIGGRVADGLFRADGADLRAPAPGVAAGPATLCIRAEALSLGGEGPGLDGQVTEARFSGSVGRVTVATVAGPLTLTAPTRPGFVLPAPGESVRVGIDPAAAHVMEGRE